MHIRFFPHPRVYPRRPRAGAVVVVMDVLRATTSMTAALDAGARAVRPCATLAQARRQAKNLRAVGKRVVLAGERGGRKPTGFDRGNSPREFSRGL